MDRNSDCFGLFSYDILAIYLWVKSYPYVRTHKQRTTPLRFGTALYYTLKGSRFSLSVEPRKFFFVYDNLGG